MTLKVHTMLNVQNLDDDLALYIQNGKENKGDSTRHKSNTHKIFSYTAAASSAFVFSASADAAIIYSGIQNITSDSSVDINGGGDDFSITVSSATGASSYGYANLNPVAGFQFIRTNFRDVKKLSSGSTISAGANFFDSQGTFRYVVRDSSGSFFEEGDWQGAVAPNTTSGFAGFKIDDNGTDIFGWLRFSIENEGAGNPFTPEGFPIKVTLIDWAYEDTGAAILAGQTSAVPLPGSLGLFAMGATGLAAFRRRKKTGQKA